MSVGVQRLRAEPEVIRKGALDKGEDATLVDVALALDTRRRALLGEADACLLYTSPSPRDRTRSRMPSSA